VGNESAWGTQSVISKGLSGISLAPIISLDIFTSTPLLAIAKAGNNQIIYSYEYLRFPKIRCIKWNVCLERGIYDSCYGREWAYRFGSSLMWFSRQ